MQRVCFVDSLKKLLEGIDLEQNYRFPPVDEYCLENGLKVILLPDREQDGLLITLQLPFGKFSDICGMEGLSELTLNLLQKGSGKYTAEEISDKLENRGVSVFSDVSEEFMRIGIRMLSKFEEEIFPVFWEMVYKPEFDKSEYNRLMREMVTALKAEIVDPHIIASHHFYKQLAGSQHPAGRFVSQDTLKKIKFTDIVSFYRENFKPQNSTLVVAGNFVPSEFKNKWNDLLLKWKGNGKKQGCYASSIAPDCKAIRLIDKPDLTQTTIIAGHPVLGEVNPLRNQIILSNYILGGGNFSSRLMAKIRSVCGKTYGINSQIISEREFGVFRIATSTQNNHVGEVMAIIMEVFREFCEHGIEEEELEKAKKFITGNMAFQLEGISNLVEKILWLQYLERPYSYLENFNELISEISLDSVNSAIKKTFFYEKLIIATVGKRVEIEEDLKKFGPVKNYFYRNKIKD